MQADTLPVVKEKPTKVRVIRYLRKVDDCGYDHNLGGVTFLFDMDYEARTVEIRHAICSPSDNFERTAGIRIAEESAFVRKFDLDLFVTSAARLNGFVSFYLDTLIKIKDIDPKEQFLLRKCAEQDLIYALTNQ
jgi:hypothetical protein